MPQQDPRQTLYGDLIQWGSLSEDAMSFEQFNEIFESNGEFREAIKGEMQNNGITFDEAFDFDSTFGLKKKDPGNDSRTPSEGDGAERGETNDPQQEAMPNSLAQAGIQAQGGLEITEPVAPQEEVSTPSTDGWTVATQPLDQQDWEKSDLDIIRQFSDPEGDIEYFEATQNFTPISFTREGLKDAINKLTERYYPEAGSFDQLYEIGDSDVTPLAPGQGKEVVFSDIQKDVMSKLGNTILDEETGNELMQELGLNPDLGGFKDFRNAMTQGGLGVIVSEIGQALNVANYLSTTRNAMRGDTDMSFEMGMRDINTDLVKGLQNVVNTKIERNPAYLGDFLRDDVAKGLGSTLGIMAAGGGSPMGMAITGGAANAYDLYSEALEAGASRKDAQTMSGLGFLIGLTEAVPISGALNRAGAGRAGIKKFAKDVLTEGAEEFTQESLTSTLNNASAQQIYDISREIFTPETFHEGSVGFVSGMLFAGGVQGISNVADQFSSVIQKKAETEESEQIKAMLLEEANRLLQISENAQSLAESDESLPQNNTNQEVGQQVQQEEGQATEEEVVRARPEVITHVQTDEERVRETYKVYEQQLLELLPEDKQRLAMKIPEGDARSKWIEKEAAKVTPLVENGQRIHGGGNEIINERDATLILDDKNSSPLDRAAANASLSTGVSPEAELETLIKKIRNNVLNPRRILADRLLAEELGVSHQDLQNAAESALTGHEQRQQTSQAEPATSEATTQPEAEEVRQVEVFKTGDGGTRGVFRDEQGNILKSQQPTEGRIIDGKAQRVPIDAKTEEYQVLAENQDLPFLPRVGNEVQTTEGPAFEIEELQDIEAGTLSIEEVEQVQEMINELEKRGIEYQDKYQVMRRANGELVLSDFSSVNTGRTPNNQSALSDPNINDLMDNEAKMAKMATNDARNSLDNLQPQNTNEHTYLLTQRPPAPGTHPTGNIIGDPEEVIASEGTLKGRPVYKLTYSEPLSQEDIKRFELTPMPSNEQLGEVYERPGRTKSYVSITGINQEDGTVNIKEYSIEDGEIATEESTVSARSLPGILGKAKKTGFVEAFNPGYRQNMKDLLGISEEAQASPSLPPTPPVSEATEEITAREETLPESKSYRLIRDENGALDVERKDGKEGTKGATRKARERLIEQYIKQNDFTQGQTSSEWLEQNGASSLDPSMTRAEELAVASDNLSELADAALEEGARIDLERLDPREMAVAMAIEEAGKVSRKSLVQNFDENKMGNSIARAYVSKSGSHIDQIAQSASANLVGDQEMGTLNAGIEPITVQDVVDFIENYPNGTDSFMSQSNPEYDKILDKMETLLGFRPTPKQVDLIATQYDNEGIQGGVSDSVQEQQGKSAPEVKEPSVAIREGKTIVPKGTEIPAGVVTGKVNDYGAHEVETELGNKIWLRADEVADSLASESEPLDATNEEDVVKLVSQYNGLIQSGLTPAEAYSKVAQKTKQGLKKAHIVKQRIQLASSKNRAKVRNPKGATTPVQIRSNKIADALIRSLKKSFPGIEVIKPDTLGEFNKIYKERGGKAQKGLPEAAYGPVYGFTVDGKIYLNPVEISEDTPAHEFAHIWITIAKQKFPSLYTQATKLIQDTEYYTNAEQDYGVFGPDGKLENRAEVLEEAVAQAMGEAAAKIEGNKTKYKKFKEWMSRLFSRIFRKMGWKVRPRIEARLPEMTMEELITEFAEDMLSGIPLGNVSSELVARIENGDVDAFSSLTIDKGLLATDLKLDDRFPVSKSDKAITRWIKNLVNKTNADRAYGRMRDLFKTDGNLPKYVAERNRKRLRKIKNYSMRVEDLLADLRRELKAADKMKPSKNALATQEQLNSAGIENQLIHASTALSSLNEADRMKALDQLTPGLRDVIVEIREAIDNLTNELRTSGIVNEKLDAVLSENLGIYLHRSFKVWDDPKHLEKVKNRQPEEWRNAIDFIKRRGETNEIRSIKATPRGDGLYDVSFRNIYGNEAVLLTLNEVEVQRILGEDAAKPLKKKFKSGGEFSHSFLPDEFGEGPKADGVKFEYDTAQAEADLVSMLDKGREITKRNELSGGAKMGSKNLDIFMKRKNIAPEIRKIMGEYDTTNQVELELVVSRTLMKQISILENERFLSDLFNIGQGTFLFDSPTGPFTEKIAGDESAAYRPLNGKYTSPEIKAAMESMRKTDSSKLMGAIMALNAGAKVSATVLSISTHVRNIYGATMTLIAQDMLRPFKRKQRKAARKAMGFDGGAGSVKIGRTSLTTGSHKNKAAKAYYNKLRELGVVDDNAYVGVVNDSLDITRNSDLEGTARFLSKVTGLPGKVYQMPDDITKIIAFENELGTLMEAYPDEVVDGKASEKIQTEAASIVRATIPTYSLTPKVTKILSRFPLLGTFVSFSSEMVRTAWNTMHIATQEIKSDNKSIRNQGMRRMASYLVMANLMAGASALLRSLWGVDDEEEEKARRFRPSFAKNSTTLPVYRGDDGKVRYIDISYVDPWNMFWRPLKAMSSNEKFWTRMGQALGETVKPFIGTEIGFSALIDVVGNDRDLIDKWFNDPSRGQYKIYETNDSKWLQMGRSIEYIWNEVKPGTLRSFDRIFIAAGLKDKQYESQSYDVSDEIINTFLGMRIRTDDVSKGLKYRGRNFMKELQADRDLVRDNQYERGQRLVMEAAEEIRKDIEAAEYFGLSPKKVNKILNDEAGISKYLIKQIREGSFEGLNEEGKVIRR